MSWLRRNWRYALFDAGIFAGIILAATAVLYLIHVAFGLPFILDPIPGLTGPT